MLRGVDTPAVQGRERAWAAIGCSEPGRAGPGAASRSTAAVLTNALLRRATQPATASPGRVLFASPRQRVPDLAARGLRTRVRAPAEGGVRGRGAARRRLRAAGEGPSRREKEEGPRRLAGSATGE